MYLEYKQIINLILIDTGIVHLIRISLSHIHGLIWMLKLVSTFVATCLKASSYLYTLVANKLPLTSQGSFPK